MTSTKPVCILGIGLIGGSLLRALAASGIVTYGWNRGDAGAAAATAAGFEATTDLHSVLRRAAADDALLVIAVPFFAVADVATAIARTAPGCAVTDVVSVKAPVAQVIAAAGLAGRYVGGHPMAGTAESGWAATDPALFRGAPWVLAVEETSEPDTARRVAAAAAAVGARLYAATPAEHDDAVARVSHLPHLLAETLAATGQRGGHLALALAAGSFRDGTRVAGTAPALVRAMCETNRAALLPALDEALAELNAVRERLAAGADLATLTEAGFRARAAWRAAQTAPPARSPQATQAAQPQLTPPPATPPTKVDLAQADWRQTALAAGRLGREITIAPPGN